MNRRALASVAALAVLLSGCAAAGGDAGITVGDPEGEGPTLATGSDDVVLRIETGGGYVPLEYAFAGGPTLLVTGDGTVIRPAPRATDAAMPALLGYESHTVDAATLADLAALAESAGLLAEPPDYQEDAPQVTDMPSTTVTLTADGETWTHSAYALGFEKESGVRADLADFVDDAADLLDGDEGVEPYPPGAVRISATPGPGGREGDVSFTWPAPAVDLRTVGSCAVVDDPDAVAAIVRTLGDANQGIVFAQNKRTWTVTGAAVLPGDVGPCAGW